MNDFDKLLEDINSEINTEKDAIIDKLIKQKLKDFKFDINNISPSLLDIIMTQQNIKVPPPERKEIPEASEHAAEMLDFINTNTAAIFSDLLVGNNVYLYGQAGSGKTVLAKKIVGILLLRNSYVINCSEFTSPIDIIGGQTIEGYKQGRLSEAWVNGGGLIIDELPKLNPNTAGLLNEALSQSADTERTYQITEDQYNTLLDEIAKNEKFTGYDVSERDGKFYKTEYVCMTDGKGDKLKKSPNFCVIATGNTDLKTVSQKFSGNNRQDYSLVDRFAGSFYLINYDIPLEKRLTYSLVFDVSIKLREFLAQDSTSVEFVSLRTMLNFNRIYEQEYLRKIKSPFANPVITIGDEGKGKTFEESLTSFIETLPKSKQEELDTTTTLRELARTDTPLQLFIAEFERLHGVNPRTGQPV